MELTFFFKKNIHCKNNQILYSTIYLFDSLLNYNHIHIVYYTIANMLNETTEQASSSTSSQTPPKKKRRWLARYQRVKDEPEEEAEEKEEELNNANG